MNKLTGIFIALITVSASVIAQETRLLRFPTVSADKIVFSYSGDLFTVDRTGGNAVKLTSDIGNEIFPKFSSDGKHIAFTGQYDGNTEVYLMPSTGGSPKRLTYTATLNRDNLSDRMGPNNIVMTWNPDNSEVIFRSRKITFNSFKGHLFSVKKEGGDSEQLPLSVGSWCSYSPDGKKMAMNQVFREFRTWKYYRGGMADDIWIYDPATGGMENITNNPAQDVFPMWYGSKIYFCSDRDRTMNIFSYDLQSKKVEKVTNFTDYDVKYPSLGKDAIVYENAGYIYLLDLKSGSNAKVDIKIHDDFLLARNEMVDASKYTNGDNHISPDGKRMVTVGRGEIWTVPAKDGITRNITNLPGSHERSVLWSPDGKHILYISDATGEDEIYIQKQDGSEAPIKLTSGSDTYKYQPYWSPDSKKIVWSDKKLRLQMLDIATKKVTLIDQAKRWEHGDVAWSHDSKWICYGRTEDNSMSRLYLYDTQAGKSYPITDAWHQSFGPEFSSDGKYLFFSSSRTFNPTYSSTEWNHSYSDMSKIYLVTLAKSTKSPLEPLNDEVSIEAEADDSKSSSKKGKDKKESEDKSVKVDIDGIEDRIVELPVAAGGYWNLSSVGNDLYYMHASRKNPKGTMKYFNLPDRKEKVVGELGSFVVSANGKKTLIQNNGAYYIIDLPKGKPDLSSKVDVSNMKMVVDKKAEWLQIYNESWRQMRDFFYDPGMHGVDWNAMRTKYEPLVKAANHRQDVNYVIGELIGELNVGHAYVNGGDLPKVEKIKMGLLGAQLSRDASGYYKIDKILEGKSWSKRDRSPLTDVGVDVNEGDYIIEINGKSVKESTSIYEMLVNKAGKTIEIKVNSSPSASGGRKSLVVPIADESRLYYIDWVEKNIEYVTEKTNGQVAYLHIPDMGVNGLNEFVKYYYPQLDKKAIIIDDRGNGGGNVSPQIIERLNRKVVFYDMARNVTTLSTDPGGMINGPKVALIDQYSASDGDIFPYRFKKYGMGKVIGRRSWGGIVGIRGSLPFIDGGDLRKPEFTGFTTDGKEWPVEGYGVDPDIEIYNNPADEFKGKDAQLDKAIEVILEELKKRPEDPKMPPFPVKTK